MAVPEKRVEVPVEICRRPHSNVKLPEPASMRPLPRIWTVRVPKSKTAPSTVCAISESTHGSALAAQMSVAESTSEIVAAAPEGSSNVNATMNRDRVVFMPEA